VPLPLRQKHCCGKIPLPNHTTGLEIPRLSLLTTLTRQFPGLTEVTIDRSFQPSTQNHLSVFARGSLGRSCISAVFQLWRPCIFPLQLHPTRSQAYPRNLFFIIFVPPASGARARGSSRLSRRSCAPGPTPLAIVRDEVSRIFDGGRDGRVETSAQRAPISFPSKPSGSQSHLGNQLHFLMDKSATRTPSVRLDESHSH
jgi:hypothetical protein